MIRSVFSAKNFFIAFLFIGVGLSLYIAYYYNQIKYEINTLVDYHPTLTTQIFDRNGDKIANIFNKEHRYFVHFEDIPPQIIEALLAIEDTMFFEHPGINIDAILRAIIKDVKARKFVEGASTITQQLVKNTLLTREKKLSRKFKEVLFSLKIETLLTKEEILERYLNQIYYGHGYYGIKTAANGYYHKDLDDLSLKEIAVLVGLPKAPSYYSPTRHYEQAMGRGNRVVSRMYSIGWIDENSYEQALQETPEVFNDTLTQNKAPYIVDEVMRQLRSEFKDIKGGGYKIHTTIDIRMQEAARKALKEGYDLSVQRAQKSEDYNQTLMDKLQGAMVSLESNTGNILALVGGIDYKVSQYNRATQGKRQPGSAFKPLIYQVAVDLGYSGASQLVDIARTYDYELDGEEKKKWKPKNYGKDYKGFISLREALVHSRNLATINLVTDIGLTTMRRALSKYHIQDLPPDLSLALGSITVSPLNFSYYYTVLSNYGTQVEPILIRSVENSYGEEITYENESEFQTTPEQAYIMIDVMKDVIKKGSGRRAKVWGIELAGKTGTTNRGIDAWFCGFSPDIQTVVWYGNDDNTPMFKGEQGGRTAAPAFASFYRQILKTHPEIKRKFEIPEEMISSYVGKQKEYFTETSKPPRIQNTQDADEELLF
ncbi:PBP1A family penicillin-binding protein [Sulfurimonas sp. MAG313]|nr:PBP1A family penicillin-binding protein [Sulfurimonas sp. MAG313]MDF1881385.1 PBP1A family penicillin-binding protein [Sulfurimonas sp. MAG313]